MPVCALPRRAARCSLPLGAAADEPQAHEVAAGFDAAPQSLYWYSEAITALNRDIGKDGALLRVYGSVAVYEYAATVGGGTIDGTLWQLDLMPGYQWVRGARSFGGFVGLDYQQSQLSPPDPTNAGARHRHRLQARGALLFRRREAAVRRQASSANTRPPSTRTMRSCASARASVDKLVHRPRGIGEWRHRL